MIRNKATIEGFSRKKLSKYSEKILHDKNLLKEKL